MVKVTSLQGDSSSRSKARRVVCPITSTRLKFTFRQRRPSTVFVCPSITQGRSLEGAADLKVSSIAREDMRSLFWSTTTKWSTRPFHHRHLATAAHERARTPQTVVEKVVQKYAVGLAPQQTVRAGDYVMIRPQHVMTHDNTGPVISKYAQKHASPISNS